MTFALKKGRCCDMGQNDTIGKLELFPSFRLVRKTILIARMTFTGFSNSLSDQESTEFPIYT